MVDVSDLQKVMMLSSEKQNISNALTQFDSGGVILSMSVGPRPPAGEPLFSGMGGIPVDTSGMQYPQAMVDAIKQSLVQRQGEIEQQLQALGVTGMEQRR